jgi:SNF2 family DNA or RNA helicase
VKVHATVLNSKPPRLGVRVDFTSKEFEEQRTRVKRATPGVRWSREVSAWTMPLTVDACHDLRREFGDLLLISDSLVQWYRSASKQQAAQTTLAAQTDADLRTLPVAAPALASTLRPDQRAGVAWIATGYRNGGLVADMPGLGKTLETIGGVLESGIKGPILVTCPRLSVKPVWFHELRRWTKDPVYMCRGTRRQREKAIQAFMEDPAERKWLIVVAEMLRVKRKPNDTDVKANAKKRGRVEDFDYPQLFRGIEWSWVIVDESHRLMGSLTVAKSNLAGEGLTLLPIRRDGQRRAMSGTPFGKGGRVQGMFGTLHWMWPDEYTSFWRWAETHFEIEEEDVYIAGGHGRKRTTKKVGPLRRGRQGEEFLRSLGPRILRRTKDEVLPNLPPKQYREVLCEMTGKQLRQYRQLDIEAEVVVDNGVVMANGVLAERTRAKQIANGVIDVEDDGHVVFLEESCKVDQLEQMLDARGMTGDEGGDLKIIVASRFNEFLEGSVLPMLRRNGVSYHLLTGSTPERQRDRIMTEFQSAGGPRVFVMNSMAGGLSITLDAADEVHILDELDNPEDNEQLEDRAHRASRNHKVTIIYYRSEGTIDTNIGEAVEGKRVEQHRVLDGRRGREYTRSIIKFRPSEEE